jgi:hypothetical protein
METAIAAVKKAEEAKAQARLKVFAARMIAHISKEAGLKPPPLALRRKMAAEAKAKAAAASKRAEDKVAAAKKKAVAARAKAARTTARA